MLSHSNSRDSLLIKALMDIHLSSIRSVEICLFRAKYAHLSIIYASSAKGNYNSSHYLLSIFTNLLINDVK